MLLLLVLLLQQIIDFQSVDILNAELLIARTKINKFRTEAERNSVYFKTERNLIAFFILREYLGWNNFGSMYGISKRACARFCIGKETLRAFLYLEKDIEIEVLMRIAERITRGTATYLLLVYGYSPYSVLVAEQLMKLNKEQEFERRVA